MKQGLLFIMMCFAINGYSQTEFSSKFKAIPRWIQVLKLKVIPATVAPLDIVALIF
jgi:hypothetical protein